MAVTARKPYHAEPRDLQKNFVGNQLVYIGWDQHLLFAAPFLFCLPPATLFGDLVEQRLKPLVAPDPDAAAVDWDKVQWLKGGQPWTPKPDASLADNGIGHKCQLRLITPGTNSLLPVG